MDAEQDNIDYGTSGWQLDKQRDSLNARFAAKWKTTQRSILLGSRQKRPEPQQMKKGASEELWKYWVQYTNFRLIEGILYRKHQTEPHLENVYQMLVPWERVSIVFELLHDSASAGHFGIEKTYLRACEKFCRPCMRMDVRNWIESCDVCLRKKSIKHQHWHSLTKWKPSHPFWQDIMARLPTRTSGKPVHVFYRRPIQ